MASELSRVSRLLAEKNYAALERRLAVLDLEALAAVLKALPPMDKLIVFKLLDASRAMELFAALPFEGKYALFCGFPLLAIAPVLEGLSSAQLRPFVQLPREDYDRMFRQLLSESPAPAR